VSPELSPAADPAVRELSDPVGPYDARKQRLRERGPRVVSRSETGLDVRFRFLEADGDELPAIAEFRDAFVYLEEFFRLAEFIGRRRLDPDPAARKPKRDADANEIGVRSISFSSPLEVVVGVGTALAGAGYWGYGVYRLADIYARTRERLAEMGATVSRHHYREEYFEALREQLRLQGISDPDPGLTQQVEAVAAVMNSLDALDVVGQPSGDTDGA
jgi:hypothetical protein